MPGDVERAGAFQLRSFLTKHRLSAIREPVDVFHSATSTHPHSASGLSDSEASSYLAIASS